MVDMQMTQIVYDGGMVDITSPEVVQIEISADRKIIWVNVDGVCRLRACRIECLPKDHDT